jgi:outer membrane protein OmpA-like peptidoglycan-associated protein
MIKKPKKIILLIHLFITSIGICFAQKTLNDGNWKKQKVILKNTPEAEIMIRVGDIDNLGFGWAEGFDPFSGNSTDPHGFPFGTTKESRGDDILGTDMVMVSSSFTTKNAPCGAEGYSGSYQELVSNFGASILPIEIPADIQIPVRAARLVMFVDDFQSPVFCSRYSVWINGTPAPFLEKVLNALDQSGPIGKIINVDIPKEFFPLLKQSKLEIKIDDPVTGAGDGYAIDFVKLLINPKSQNADKTTLKGLVIDAENKKPVPNANISLLGTDTKIKTNEKGEFVLNNILPGLVVLQTSATNYKSTDKNVDVIFNQSNSITIELEKKQEVVNNGYKGVTEFTKGTTIILENIQFKPNSSELNPSSYTELDKLANFLTQNQHFKVAINGHTDNGTNGTAPATLQKLSEDRAKSVVNYLIKKNIAQERLQYRGYGSIRPIADNKTPEGQAKNRRVEFEIISE